MVFKELSTLFSRYSQYAFSNTTSLRKQIILGDFWGGRFVPHRGLHSLAARAKSLPAKNFGVGVHDIQGLFEAPILDEADDFTVKGRRVIFVFMQNYDTRDAQQQLKWPHASRKRL